MTNEQINIAIAQACGWTGFNPDNIPDCLQYTARAPSGKWGLIPDYLNDLNAMHEAEKTLTDVQSTFYWKTLSELVNNTVGHDFDNQFECIHATAAQRAEAFLKTINKWEGGSDDN
jgi:hypothetical protein